MIPMEKCVERHEECRQSHETNHQAQRARDRIAIEDDGCAKERASGSEKTKTGTDSFLLVPLQHDAVHDAADLEQLLLVMDHVGAGEAVIA